jgi:uncharacterized protein (DUF2132 family)
MYKHQLKISIKICTSDNVRSLISIHRDRKWDSIAQKLDKKRLQREPRIISSVFYIARKLHARNCPAILI